ncbi:6-phosphogluconate dehydrogenase [Ktedonobacter sp. SOSP1-52]|uniref:NAD(P)-dependent oxidoreductase n=1 Tax=Ktedonobacter sp. SOSP1-52 TaxID=2778366 RepID=UPI001A194AE7|nr:6-phosphogluconate dehydrogenase [Ktedonobacter sp. SOSP1-52]
MSTLQTTIPMTIGFVGLGDQGAPIARAISEAGYELHVWARRSQSLEALTGVKYQAYDTVSEMAAASDLVGLCLTEDSDIQRVALDGGLLANMKPGSVLVNYGTGLPAFAAELTTIASAYQVHVIDAPVSGGHSGAVAKQLLTMVGGEPEVAERCRPVFETFSKKIAYLGLAGSGQMAKLINNALLLMNMKNIEDILQFGEHAGLAIPALIDVLRAGTARSYALETLGTILTTEKAPISRSSSSSIWTCSPKLSPWSATKQRP